MEEIINSGAGLDVHKKTVVACVSTKKIKKEVRSFGTTTKELSELSTWLSQCGVTHIAMESTGIYWKPIYNVLEDNFILYLANARNIKNVPGRKTDVKDAEWICRLLKAGLIQPSLVQPREFRSIKELSRYRKKLIYTQTDEKNRIHKVLESANIKLSSVLSDIFGKTGRAILDYLLSEEDVEFPKLSRRLHSSKEEILLAIEGKFTLTHKFLLKKHLENLEYLNSKVVEIETEMDSLMEKHQKDLFLIESIPGVGSTAAKDIIAAIGVDMSVFPSKRHLASWAGVCPGNNESAGKKFSGRTTHGDPFLKATLVEAAWAATRTKNTYFAAKYRQLAPKKGSKRALLAIGHKIIVNVYTCLKTRKPYQELGENYLLEKRKDRLVKSYLKKLTNLGCSVQVSPRA